MPVSPLGALCVRASTPLIWVLFSMAAVMTLAVVMPRGADTDVYAFAGGSPRHVWQLLPSGEPSAKVSGGNRGRVSGDDSVLLSDGLTPCRPSCS